VIQIVTAVVQMTGLDFNYVLCRLPAAIAMQIFHLWRQRRGVELVKDNRQKIRRLLTDG
jgi:hypothetical protein